MKKILTLMLFFAPAAGLWAQEDAERESTARAAAKEEAAADTAKAVPVISNTNLGIRSADQLLPAFCIDGNFKLGWQNQFFTANTFYKDRLDVASHIPKLATTVNTSIGGDIQVSYFFDKQHRFGVGLGLMYMQQSGQLSYDSLHVEYKATDKNGDVFRQVVHSNNTRGGISENVNYTTWSIPILAKFKHQFNGKKIGIFAEAGGLINVYTKNTYSTNANLDYEAIYQFGPDGKGVYDQSLIPQGNDWLLTKKFYSAENPDLNVNSYFQDLHDNKGYNVGLAQVPAKASGTHSYNIGLGGMAQAGVSYQFDYRATINLGGYYMIQMLNNSANSNYMVTDKAGSYNSLLLASKTTYAQNYGITIGLRFFLGQDLDTDGDGVPDKKDKCRYQPGLAQFGGCPDADNDGIPDNEDACPSLPGPACTNGCPDKDDDCVADIEDKCPDVPGLEIYEGCPDNQARNKPVVIENKATTETVSETTKIDSRYTTVSTTTINFGTNDASIPQPVKASLDDAAASMAENGQLVVYVIGYTDNVGDATYNLKLSVARAEAVRNYLIGKGVSKSRIITGGYGEGDPVMDNKSENDRAQNRRTEVRLMMKK